MVATPKQRVNTMANMKRQTLRGAKIWVWEGDLVSIDNGNGIVPMTFICVQLEGAPDDQVWFYKHFYLAEWCEDSYVASSRPEEIIEEMKKKGDINLVDHWETDPNCCVNGNVVEHRARIKALQESEEGFPQ